MVIIICVRHSRAQQSGDAVHTWYSAACCLWIWATEDSVLKKDAVPMRLVSMLALAASRIPGSACGFPLTVPCSGLRFVLWEGAAVPRLVTSRGIFFQRGPL